MSDNIYYDPEKFGLEIVATAGYNGYDFDITGIWKDDKGNYYLESDSGCSCVTPFDGIAKVSDMQPLSLAAVKQKVSYLRTEEYSFSTERKMELISALAKEQR